MGIFDAIGGIGRKAMDAARKSKEEANEAYQKAQRMDYRELVRASDRGTFGEKSGYGKALKERIKEISKDMDYDELVHAWEVSSVPTEKQCYANLVMNEIKKKSDSMSDREVVDEFQFAITSIEKNAYAEVLEKRGYLEKNSQGKYQRTSKKL